LKDGQITALGGKIKERISKSASKAGETLKTATTTAASKAQEKLKSAKDSVTAKISSSAKPSEKADSAKSASAASSAANTAGSGKVVAVPASPSGSPKYLLPRQVPGPDTPPAIAKLLVDANREEKNAIVLRKKADKCMEYASSGLMSYEQQKKMEIAARQNIKQADEAEERCQELRRIRQSFSAID